MKISIIIPAYNLEDYIAHCLDSLVNQDIDHKDYEILVVNDGSTDKTELIITGYSNSYSHIHIYNKKNEGVSTARNLGIRKSKGEYILFVDGDDWMCENVLNKIYKDLKRNNLEIGRFGYNSIFKDENKPETKSLPRTESPMSGLKFVINNNIKDFYPWLYAISKNFINMNNLLFNPNLSYCEDKEFMLRALYFSKKFQNFDYVHYNYKAFRMGSATTVFSNKHLLHAINSTICTFEFSEDQNISNFQDYLKKTCIQTLEKSYYSLTVVSIWSKFWIWKNYLTSNYTFNKTIYKKSKKLYLLKNSAPIFYLFFYLPRATFHKLKSLKSSFTLNKKFEITNFKMPV